MQNIERWNQQFQSAEPEQIIAWAADTFGPHIAATSSFQTQSLPLLHIMTQVAPHLPVIFLDTGYHFPETLLFRDRLIEEWELNVKVVRAVMSKSALIQRYGQNLYRTNPDLCCYIHKVEPMQQAMQALKGWISGIRRDQSPARAHTQIVEPTPQGTVRIHPLANWTNRDVWQYINHHQLPEHPLFSQGYLSIGCAPCTQPIFDDNERNGRWSGQDKVECGLHTQLRDNKITIDEIITNDR